MPDPPIAEDRLAQVLTKVVEQLKPPPKGKDGYDKFAAVSPFISSLLVIVLGTWFTAVFQRNADNLKAEAEKQREERQERKEVLRDMIPYLNSNDKNKQRIAAIVLGQSNVIDKQTANAIVNLLSSSGDVSPLKKIPSPTGTNDKMKDGKHHTGSPQKIHNHSP
jgi:hypothetical protein